MGIGIFKNERGGQRQERSSFLVKAKRATDKGKPGAMRRFLGGYDCVQVWSGTFEQHSAALDVYKRRGWELVKGPIDTGRSENPLRSTVRRKIRAGDW